ncbi:GNAT family N-acetyltransferase [Colwellia sp. 6M3]|uniref:GNAT family N-acetyltransferase n=1 Tax=Colwellia sp. 6M3 TaxID=2759849 RepID=UPI0015F71CFF|nr:GNAT family N-acetyltransferase [Colwellia sp. 6M3]MBA6415306.1 GNAT family N-acetyltransferase [Colwellia sp. 6M3]
MSNVTHAVNASNDNIKHSAIISFRRAIASDRDFLLNLRKASMEKHLNNAGIYLDDNAHLQRIDEFFADSHLILYKKRPVGLLKLGLFANKIHVRQFQLLPTFQGVGIGSKVLEAIKRKAQEKRLNITLNVLINNPAKQLYLRHDFVVISSNELEFQMHWQCQ